MLTLVACGFAAVPAADSSTTVGAGAQSTAQQIGTLAYEYGFPLMEFLRVERQMTSVTVPDARGDAPINQLGNTRALADPSERVIVAPNNDTLYTIAHIALASQPQVLHVPAITHHRYFVFEFMDPYTNVIGYIGTRTTGNRGGNWAITGPHWRGRLPQGVRRFRSTYDDVWLIGRTLVNGPSDLATVLRIQDHYRLQPLSTFGISWSPPRPRHIITTPIKLTEPRGVAFFDALGSALARYPPPARDAATLQKLAQVGVGPGLHPSHEHLDAATLAGLGAAVASAPSTLQAVRKSATQANAAKHNGWSPPPADIGDYGTDYLVRAIVAFAGLGANTQVEAMYPSALSDTAGEPLDAAHRYVLHFAPGGQPPARYFWSITLYDANSFLVANPINRWAIGDRTSGLKHNRDGSLDIYVQRDVPSASRRANWLPAPGSGGFSLTMRIYGPGRSALDGSYVYPTITRVG